MTNIQIKFQNLNLRWEEDFKISAGRNSSMNLKLKKEGLLIIRQKDD